MVTCACHGTYRSITTANVRRGSWNTTKTACKNVTKESTLRHFQFLLRLVRLRANTVESVGAADEEPHVSLSLSVFSLLQYPCYLLGRSPRYDYYLRYISTVPKPSTTPNSGESERVKTTREIVEKKKTSLSLELALYY